MEGQTDRKTPSPAQDGRRTGPSVEVDTRLLGRDGDKKLRLNSQRALKPLTQTAQRLTFELTSPFA